MTNLIRWILPVLLASSIPSQAQEPVLIKTSILTYAPVPLPEGFTAFFKTEESIFRFSSSPSNLGVPVPYTGPRRFVLRATEEEFALPEDELKLKPPLAYVDLPAKSDMILILAIPGENGKIRLGTYDVSSDTLKPGNYRVFNFSKKSVSVILGDQKFSVRPRMDRTVDDRKWHEETIALPLQIGTVVNKKTTLVYSSFWEHYPMRRNLLFLFDGRHPSEPVIFASFDVGTPPKREAVR